MPLLLIVAVVLLGSLVRPELSNAQSWFYDEPGTDITTHALTQRVLPMARDYWKTDACHGDLRVTVQWTPPEGAAWAANGVCKIVVNVSHWTSYQSNPRAFCVAMTHELGHIVGHDHSHDPNSPMYEGPDRNFKTMQPACWSTFSPPVVVRSRKQAVTKKRIRALTKARL